MTQHREIPHYDCDVSKSRLGKVWDSVPLSEGLGLVSAAVVVVTSAITLTLLAAGGQEGLVVNPSFEQVQAPDRFGLVFPGWGGWKYEGECSFQVGRVARSGEASCLLVGESAQPKIRIAQKRELPPGRYRITAYLRGLEIGRGKWNATTELMFNDKYMQLDKNGTFGWTRLSYVAELTEKTEAGPSFGLFAPGWLWIDDVMLEPVGDDVPLTEKPVLGEEIEPIEPPADPGPNAVRCPECQYRNRLAWQTCYACGTRLAPDGAEPSADGPATRVIASFDDGNPFSGGRVVSEHATTGQRSLRLQRGYASMDARQDWTGYDYLKADVLTNSNEPVPLTVEIRDKATEGYWTRVNYQTVVPPGRSTLTLPLEQLFVGEKSRPGRKLMVGHITRLVFSVGDAPPAPIFIDHVRLERDDSAREAVFDGLHAFDFGPADSPLMPPLTRISPATAYSAGRGYGLKDAKVWRSHDVLQPEPLYQDFICIERGGLAVDVPNGRYRVFLNMDNPSGYWGEYQAYRRRTVLAEGQPVLTDRMDFAAFRRKYFRHWDSEDLPSDNTFEKYQQVYYDEKLFDVEVNDGQLNIDFVGENWACSVSTVIVFPVEKAAEGERFLAYVEGRRRFYFDNYFKRVLHQPTGDPLQPTSRDRDRGYVVFQRDYMEDVYYNDTPRHSERVDRLALAAFAGELEPVTFSFRPLKDLGTVRVLAGELNGPGGNIPADAMDVKFVSYRLNRMTMEGSVYTIAPRLLMPSNKVDGPKGVSRRWWVTVRTPPDAKPGVYEGTLMLAAERGMPTTLPITLTVLPGRLDPVNIPVGPFGHTIRIPWPGEEPAAKALRDALRLASLRKMRDYGFTAMTGMPTIRYRGFQDGAPVFDFKEADEQMRLARRLGFTAVVSYGAGVQGFNPYYQDLDAMRKAGFDEYGEFISAVYTPIQHHAEQAGWIPVCYNLGDEPIGENLKKAITNAEAYTAAFPQGPPLFTAASSFHGGDEDDPHFALSKAVHIANWNLHDEAGVRMLHDAGGHWAFYNGANRWTFGQYMFKAVRDFGMTFRVAWHWNIAAGDPYYALDCREDDYAWCNTTPEGHLVPSIQLERLREGLDDYRRLLTLRRLTRANPTHPESQSAATLIQTRLNAFELGQRDHDELFGRQDWPAFRETIDAAIGGLR